MVDPKGELIPQVRPAALVDAILAKKNLGTTRDMAPLTIALGPGFTAGVDVDLVVETKRGHRLGRIIREGAAIPNTGVPGVIGGYGAERVIHAEKAGVFRNVCAIGDLVSAGETIAEIETPDGIRTPVTTRIAGILRGLLRDGYPVTPGFKVADVDPRREELENCFLISDKARCIAGSVLELIADKSVEIIKGKGLLGQSLPFLHQISKPVIPETHPKCAPRRGELDAVSPELPGIHREVAGEIGFLDLHIHLQ